MEIDVSELAYAPSTGVRRVHETRWLRLPRRLSRVTVSWSTIRAVSRSRSCAGPRRAGGRSMRIPATRAASPRACSSFAGKAKCSTRATTRSATAIFSAGATGPRKRPRTAPARRASARSSGARTIIRTAGRWFIRCRGQSFVVPLALPGDDVSPERFITFWCDGSRGLYIHPNVWHGAFVPLDDHAEFLDRQGRVHARVSVDFPREFGCYLGAPLRRPNASR